MVGDGEGGGRAVKVDHPTQIFFVRFFFEDATSDVDLFLNESISTHSRFHSREYLFCFCKISGRELDLG